jgi:hypothetical protein
MLCLFRGPRTPFGTAGEISKAIGFKGFGGVLGLASAAIGLVSFFAVFFHTISSTTGGGLLCALSDFLEEIFILIDDCRLVFKEGLSRLKLDAVSVNF